MHPLGVDGGMAPGRDSSLWLSDLKAVTINNRTWEQGRCHCMPDSGDSSSTWKSVIFPSCFPGNTVSQQHPSRGTPFFFFFLLNFVFFFLNEGYMQNDHQEFPFPPSLHLSAAMQAGALLSDNRGWGGCLQQGGSNISAICLFSNNSGSCKLYQLWLIVKGRGKKASWACRLQTGRL